MNSSYNTLVGANDPTFVLVQIHSSLTLLSQIESPPSLSFAGVAESESLEVGDCERSEKKKLNITSLDKNHFCLCELIPVPKNQRQRKSATPSRSLRQSPTPSHPRVPNGPVGHPLPHFPLPPFILDGLPAARPTAKVLAHFFMPLPFQQPPSFSKFDPHRHFRSPLPRTQLFSRRHRKRCRHCLNNGTLIAHRLYGRTCETNLRARMSFWVCKRANRSFFSRSERTTLRV